MSPIKSLYRRATCDLSVVATCAVTDIPSSIQQASSSIVTPSDPSPFSSLVALATSTYSHRPSTIMSSSAPAPVVSSPMTTTDVDVDMLSNGSSDTCRSTCMPSAGADSTTTATMQISKKERRLIMNRNSARLRRKRHAEKMDEMEGTVRKLEISNKRMRTENDELRKAIADLKVLVQQKKQGTTAGGAANSASESAVSTPPVASVTKDARYESLAATALAKYATTGTTLKTQEEKISPKPPLLSTKPIMSSNAVSENSISTPSNSPTDNFLLRSYLLCRAAALDLLTRNPSAAPSSSIQPNTGISVVVGMTSATDEIEATKLAAQQLAALAFIR